MSHPPEEQQVLLVACVLCQRLHEPRRELDLNPICTGCAEALPRASLTGPEARPSSDDEAP
jgi:hypothetical protein